MGKQNHNKGFSNEEIALCRWLREDADAFCEYALDFKPHKQQRNIFHTDLHECESIVVGSRRGGKTFGVRKKVVWDLFRLPGIRIFIYNPSESQSNVLFDGVCRDYRTSPFLKKYVPHRLKGACLTVGSEPHESTLQILKVGLDAKSARGFGTDGCGYVIGDESNAHGTAGWTIADNVEPFISAGGGLVYMSSAGESIESNFFYSTYKYYAEAEAAGNKRYRVFQFDLRDCEHLSQDIIESQRRKAEAQGRLWAWEREVLGVFNRSEGAYFDRFDIQACIERNLSGGGRLDTYVWSFDPGGRNSPAVVMIGRLNQAKNRIEVIDTRSFVFTTNRRYKTHDGHEDINEFEDIIDACIHLRKQYPPLAFYYDPNCEASLSERLENQYAFPMIPCLIGGYAKKHDFLEQLKRALAERKVVWNDRRITEQLERFAPPVNPNTNKYEYPDEDYDFIVCLGMLYQYLGDRVVSPFLCEIGTRAVW